MQFSEQTQIKETGEIERNNTVYQYQSVVDQMENNDKKNFF